MRKSRGGHGTTIIVECPCVDETVFRQLMGHRVHELLAAAMYLERQALDTTVLTRPLLGEILSQAGQMEELLDAYGARSNIQWYSFRQLVAIAKGFARAGYKLLHVQHSWQAYHLLPVEGSIAAETKATMLFVGNALMQVSSSLVAKACALGLPVPKELPERDYFKETLPAGRLPRNRTTRKVESAEETVAHVATAFLNLAAESDLLHTAKRAKPADYGGCIPDPVSEERLRQLGEKFHNLQSMYDTFVSDTDTEDLDSDLRVLRGHISIIYHLLDVAMTLTHHYERYMMVSVMSSDTDILSRPLMDPKELLAVLMEYCFAFSGRYLVAASGLSRAMLRRYAKIERIRLPVPRYRGFHVRPSTMVSKIAHHYGSELRMELDGEVYDASAPLDLFRANETVNAKKRRMLAQEISCLQPDVPPDLSRDMIDAVRQIVLALAASGKVVIYEQPLPLNELQPGEGETLTQFAVDEITRLLATGKIDIESDVHVTFVGDRRILEDVRLLAETGYGEDLFGNNIPLPKELAYLRR